MSKPLNIVQHGGGWITNIGNAFFDLGSAWAIDQAFDQETNINITSSFARWATSKLKRGPVSFFQGGVSADNVFDLGAAYDADYVVRAGAHLSQRWIDLHGDVIEEAAETDAKIIFHGVGFSEWSYETDEIEKVQSWMEEIKPYAIISRDERTFSTLRGIAEHSYNGIDCGFYVSDLHEPIAIDESYRTLNFDKKEEPDRVLTHNPNLMNVRPHHSFWFPWKWQEYPRMLSQYYNKSNVFVSDIPQEYLDIYAGATETHADRVHACVATLAFGSPARLYIDTPRSGLLDRVGHGDITEKLIEPNTEKLETEKNDQIDFLREIVNS